MKNLPAFTLLELMLAVFCLGVLVMGASKLTLGLNNKNIIATKNDLALGNAANIIVNQFALSRVEDFKNFDNRFQKINDFVYFSLDPNAINLAPLKSGTAMPDSLVFSRYDRHLLKLVNQNLLLDGMLILKDVESISISLGGEVVGVKICNTSKNCYTSFEFINSNMTIAS